MHIYNTKSAKPHARVLVRESQSISHRCTVLKRHKVSVCVICASYTTNKRNPEMRKPPRKYLETRRPVRLCPWLLWEICRATAGGTDADRDRRRSDWRWRSAERPGSAISRLDGTDRRGRLLYGAACTRPGRRPRWTLCWRPAGSLLRLWHGYLHYFQVIR